MHLFNECPLLVGTLLLSTLAWPDCLPVEEAKKHVGEIKCITGKVVRVKQGSRGVHFLDFCDDFRLCPFTVVIFPSDLKNVGDVRQLQGRLIEIHGQVGIRRPRGDHSGRIPPTQRLNRQNPSPAQELRRGTERSF